MRMIKYHLDPTFMNHIYPTSYISSWCISWTCISTVKSKFARRYFVILGIKTGQQHPLGMGNNNNKKSHKDHLQKKWALVLFFFF